MEEKNGKIIILDTEFTFKELRDIRNFLDSLGYFNFNLNKLLPYEITFILSRAEELKIKRVKEYMDLVARVKDRKGFFNYRKVLVVETGEIYSSIQEAAKAYKMSMFKFRALLKKEPNKYIVF